MGRPTYTRLRRARIAELLATIDAALRDAGIAAVALKGAALYELGIYPAAERPMGDVDLLLAPTDMAPAAQALRSLGFTPGIATWRHQSLEPDRKASVVRFGEHIDNPIKIEIHARIAERLPVREFDITELEWPAQPRAGLNPYPSRAALMRHLLLHAAGNMRARALRLIQLHDLAVLAPRLSAEDWAELLGPRLGGAGAWWAFPPLALALRYAPRSVPAEVLAALKPGCPPLLRHACQSQRLADVSWSRLGIQAFPGIEWSTSPLEALRFVKSRVWPGRATLAELDSGNKTLAYASANSWYSDSHAMRILRWAFSNPPRVHPLHGVRLALGDAGAPDPAGRPHASSPHSDSPRARTHAAGHER